MRHRLHPLLLACLAGCSTTAPQAPATPAEATTGSAGTAPLAAYAQASSAPAPAAPVAPATPTPPQFAGKWQLAATSGKAEASSGFPMFAADGDRETEWNPHQSIQPGKPQWLALPLDEPAKQTLAVLWHGHALHYQNFDYGRPRTYDIEASSDSTNGSDGHWTNVGHVTDNLVRTRVDLVDAPGARWLRLSFLTAWGNSAQMEPFLREVMIYERQGDGQPDVYAVYGDSTTAVGLDPEQPETFDAEVTSRHAGYHPLLVPAGTGGDEIGDAPARLSVGLPTIPRGSVVGLCYGTNDASHGTSLDDYKKGLQAAIDQIRAAGDVPLLAVLPWSLNGQIQQFADACRDVAAKNQLPPGPDFCTYFQAHPEQLQVDKVHPTPVGAVAMQRMWAEAADFRYRQP